MASAYDRSLLLNLLDYNNGVLMIFADVELKKLTGLFSAITVLLNDADHKQTEYPAVKSWLENFVSAVYDWEDLLDELATDEAQYESASFDAETIPWIEERMKEMNLIVGKMEQLEKEARFLGLTGSTEGQPLERPVTSSLIDESIILGRENDREAIIELLLSRGDDGISVIPIVGMAGLGKTTLAQLAFNHPKVWQTFDLRAWVRVGFHFDICKVTRTILEAVTPNKSESNDLNLLQIRLKESLEGRKFLLALDDVWNQDYGEWMIFQTPLTYGAPGSKIIVTTRRSGVAQVVSSKPAYHLGFLNDEDCWFVLSKHAFGNESPNSYPHLEAVGKEIARKCCGLPSAAYALGSLLRSKRSVREWEAILKKNILSLETGTASRILPAIRLSYYHLPTRLRQCFLYCSIFPRGYEFDKEQLILLWLAEGFLEQTSDDRKEDAGDRYFQELLSSSFFQKSGANFVMLDLIAELAQSLAGNHCFRLEDGQELQYAISDKIRHLSFVRDETDSHEQLCSIFEATRLATFLPINSPNANQEYFQLSDDLLKDLLERLPVLRVLSFAFYDITELPLSLGKLKHLRYLDLSYTPLKILPESICYLHNLQTLNLSYCPNLSELPEGMMQLINLHHLFMKETPVLDMPLGIGRLTNLQTLSNFVVGKEGSGTDELSQLSDMRVLSISGLQNLDTRREYDILMGMEFLEKLELEWSSGSHDSEQEIVLQNLMPPDDLNRLVIESYGGNTFPKWLGDSSVLSQIVFLRLSNCRYCSCLPTLGQLPSLEVLEIEGLDGVRCIDQEFYRMSSSFKKPFQCLKILKFDRMLHWEEWETLENEDGEFLCLLELYIINCPRLIKSLPSRLPSLKKLVISSGCPILNHLVPLPVSSQCNILIEGEEAQKGTWEYARTLPGYPRQKKMSIPPEKITPLWTASESRQRKKITTGIKRRTDVKARARKFLPLGKLPSIINISRSAPASDDSESEKFSSDQTASQRTKLDVVYQTKMSNLAKQIPSQKTSDGSAYDVAPKSSHRMTETTEGTQLSEDEMQLQYSSPRTWKVSYVEQLKELPKGLQSLRIEGCETLDSLPKEIFSNHPSLQHLYVIDCGSLESFPECDDSEAQALETLNIRNCRKLKFSLSSDMKLQFPHLEHLCIERSCDGLKSFTLSYFTKLRILCLADCINLQSLEIEEGASDKKLDSLESLEIRDCPKLVKESFPQGLPASSLSSIVFSNCKSLQSLPIQQDSPKSLRSLFVSKCPELESLASNGLPTSLNLLCISSCNKISITQELGLKQLQDLQHFEIEGGCVDMESFPSEGLLPENLVSLYIGKLMNLESLDEEGLQELSCLEKLEINCCRKLRSLPEELPPSLSTLSIKECPLLQNWTKIKPDHCWTGGASTGRKGGSCWPEKSSLVVED